MKQTRAAMAALAAMLVIVVIFSSVRILRPSRETRTYTISVIVEDSSSNRWRSFREGLSQGAAEMAAVVNVVSTGTFEDLTDLTQVIRREQAYGADGVIVCPAMDDESGELAQLLSSTPAVLAESSISGQQLIDTVGPDGYELGSLIARQLMEQEALDGETTLGVLSGNQRTPMMQNCLQGFTDTLGDHADRIQWTLSRQALGSGDLLSVSMEAKPVNILVALDNGAMENAIDYLNGNNKYGCRLYGAGRSEQCIYYLDRGMIRALAVPDEFMMGYESMVLLLQKLSTYSPAARSEKIEILSVTGDTIHDRETAGILFPTVS